MARGVHSQRFMARHERERGRVGYLVLYLLGAPVGLLILLWVLLGDNLITPG
jgi:hypothetical protein